MKITSIDIKRTTDFMQRVDQAIDEYLCNSPFKADYVVAGGCIRDCLLGRSIKDIDIVVQRRDVWEATWPGGKDYGPTGEFKATTEPPFYIEGFPVQLVYRSGDVSLASMEAHHSIGVSNVYWSDGLLTISPMFIQDVVEEKHTVNRTRWAPDKIGDQRLEDYITKVRKKYDWPLRASKE